MKVTREQYDAVAVGDVVEDWPVIVRADRKESKDGRVFADLVVKLLAEHRIGPVLASVASHAQ